MGAPLLLGHAHGQELAPASDQGVQVAGGHIWARAHRGLDLGREAGQHPGVEPIGLGQNVAAAGEVAHLPRIDHHRRQPRGDQRRVDRLLVAATGFQHDPGGLQGLRAAHQRGMPCGGVGDPPGVLRGVARDIQMIAGDVQAEIRGLGHFGTLRCGAGLPPSLARCGLALAALATVRALDQRHGPGRPRYTTVSCDLGADGLSRPGASPRTIRGACNIQGASLVGARSAGDQGSHKGCPYSD